MRTRVTIVLVAAMATACAHPPPPPTDWRWRTTATDTELRGFAKAATLLDGMDEARPGALVAAGDRALFGVRLLDGEDHREWFLRVTALQDEEALAPVDAPTTIAQLLASTRPAFLGWRPGQYVLQPQPVRSERLRIEVFAGDLALLGDEEVAVTGLLFHGAVAGCQGASSIVPPPRNGVSPQTSAVFALGDVMRVVKETDSLMAILREVARLPPLWTLLRGVKVSLGTELAMAVPVPTPDGSVAFSFPMRILINGHPALLCTVTATDPAPPVRVCGGFTRLVAQDPDDAERRVVLTLLAARSAAR